MSGHPNILHGAFGVADRQPEPPIRVFTNSDCKVTFFGLFGVCEAQEEVSRKGGQEDVWSLQVRAQLSTYSITASGAKRQKPSL